MLDLDIPSMYPDVFFMSESFPWGSEYVQKSRAEKMAMGYSSHWRAIVVSTRYWLAESLSNSGAVDEAAEVLRKLAREFGDEEVVVLVYSGHMTCDWSRGFRVKLGAEVTCLLDLLHATGNASAGSVRTNTMDKVSRRIENVSF